MNTLKFFLRPCVPPPKKRAKNVHLFNRVAIVMEKRGKKLLWEVVERFVIKKACRKYAGKSHGKVMEFVLLAVKSL